MRLHLKPGIAAFVTIFDGYEAVYMGPDPCSGPDDIRVEWYDAASGERLARNDVPYEARHLVHTHFARVFALPVEEREAYLRSLK